MQEHWSSCSKVVLDVSAYSVVGAVGVLQACRGMVTVLLELSGDDTMPVCLHCRQFNSGLTAVDERGYVTDMDCMRTADTSCGHRLPDPHVPAAPAGTRFLQ